MAGLLRAPAARALVTALRERFDLPVHLHTHDTPGGQLATLVAAIDAGVDAVDAAAALAGTTTQPPSPPWSPPPTARLGRRGCRFPRSTSWSPTGSPPAGSTAVRSAALPHRSRLHPRDPRRPAVQPPPTGDRTRPGREVRADRGHVCRGQRHPRQHHQGDPVDQGGRRPGACTWSAVGADPAEFAADPARFDIPDSVIGFLNGELGDPPGGWPEPFRTEALAGRSGSRRSASSPTNSARRWPSGTTDRRRTLNELLFPGPTRDFLEARASYGDVSVLPTLDYLYGLRCGDEHEVYPRGGQDDLSGSRRSASPTSVASGP